MEYLKAAVSLKSLIKDTNSVLLQRAESVLNQPNRMRVMSDDGNIQEIEMEAFTNDFVSNTLKGLGQSTAFVITDIASMVIKGTEVTYLLYKGYHSSIEKGLVLFQVVNKETLAPIGPLQFSNMEENIFYPVDTPQGEESSCSAMETDKKIEGGKSIVFLIGNMDEQRLAYDIERLIFDTVSNVEKHPKLNFSFIIHIAHYGGAPTDDLKAQVSAIDAFTQQYIYPEYPNATFDYTYEQDGS